LLRKAAIEATAHCAIKKGYGGDKFEIYDRNKI